MNEDARRRKNDSTMKMDFRCPLRSIVVLVGTVLGFLPAPYAELAMMTVVACDVPHVPMPFVASGKHASGKHCATMID